MNLSFEALNLPAESEALVSLLTGDRWPFHGDGKGQVTREQVLKGIDNGNYTGSDSRTFWIVKDEEKIGMIRLFDLDDIPGGAPLFDLRIKSANRGQGIGRQAVTWLTRYLFESWPELQRIEGTTRGDNLAMRRVFRQCGYAKEGHYRQAWSGIDAIHYGMLRQDWASGSLTPVNWADE